MKLKAFISVCDLDYGSNVGYDEIYIKTWEDAEQHCKSMTNSCHRYSIDAIVTPDGSHFSGYQKNKFKEWEKGNV